MSAEPANQSSNKPSSWTRRPSKNLDDAVESLDRESVTSRETAEIADRVSQGLRRASSALVPPLASDFKGLLPGANLPHIDTGEALETLAFRIDREGDLWRGLTLRALARAVWADRFTQAVSVLSAVGCIALAAVAALGALFGSEHSLPRAALVLTGALTLVLGAAVVARTSAGIRRAQRTIANNAASRADLAELRLHRIAIVMATRETDAELFRDALARLEKDASAPPE